MATFKQRTARSSAPHSRWTRFGRRAPPLDVLIEVRHRRDPIGVWRCIEIHGNGLYSLEISRPYGRSWTSVYDFMQWRFPGGRGMTKTQIANVQRAMRARATRLKNLADQAQALKLKRDRAALKRSLARTAREAALPVFRIRRYSGRAGGSNYYHHADIVARNRREALRAAKEGRVTNWRWIDTYDSCDKAYCRYEYLCSMRQDEAKQPAPPITKREALRRDRARGPRQRHTQQ